jgi:peptide/nickel transport system substrate-binding protein
MTRTDSFVVGTLVVLLAIVAGLVGVPALSDTVAPASAAPSDPVPTGPFREGVIGRPVSIGPFTARSQVDRDLVALIFSGLVRNGPGGTLVPDLAKRWSVDAAGKVWTFELRDDATWQDGEPVTAEDVAFTIRTLQDPAYTGPAAGSWSEVEVRAISDRLVTFTLATPLGGFLQAATQPIAPAHLLADVPVAALAEDPFGTQPVGSGPFALAELTDTGATLVPVASISDASGPTPSSSPADSLATAPPMLRPDRPLPYLSGIEMSFFDDGASLAAAYRAGELDAAAGLAPGDAAKLATEPASRLLRYPSATLTSVLLNLRPDHPEFSTPAIRTALLAGIDRTLLVDEVLAGQATVATGPIPPSSPLYDAAADPPVAYDRAAAKKALKSAGWTQKKDGWHLPKDAKPLSIEVLSPDEGSNPTVWAVARQVVSDWRRLGLTVTHVGLPAREFVTERLAKGTFQVAVTDMTMGLDPDLYPLLASSQTVTGGSNIIGVQDPTLDKLLVAARAPGTPQARAAAYAKLQAQLAKGRYLLPLAFPDEVMVARDTLSGPAIRQVADASDRFWDVLTWRLAGDR